MIVIFYQRSRWKLLPAISINTLESSDRVREWIKVIPKKKRNWRVLDSHWGIWRIWVENRGKSMECYLFRYLLALSSTWIKYWSILIDND